MQALDVIDASMICRTEGFLFCHKPGESACGQGERHRGWDWRWRALIARFRHGVHNENDVAVNGNDT